MLNRLEIILSDVNNKPVSLKSMSIEALESFMAVMSSLKSIAESTIIKEELIFSIREGSASCAVGAPNQYMDSIYGQMDLAIKGKSYDKEITKHLRLIQDQLKREKFGYTFRYEKGSSGTIDIHPLLINSTRISVKRKRVAPFKHKLILTQGYLNQIGGNDPNYHFNAGLKESITIDCTKTEAMKVNKFLYKDVHSLLLCKKWDKPDKKDEYSHKFILEENLVKYFKLYLESYNLEENLVNKLTLTHDFVDNMFEISDNGHKILNYLLIAFNDKCFHLSELKTLLVISKPFKEHKAIKDARLSLLETYEKIKI